MKKDVVEWLYYVDYVVARYPGAVIPFLFRRKVVPYTKDGKLLPQKVVFEKGKRLADKLDGSLVKCTVDSFGFVKSSVVYVSKPKFLIKGDIKGCE